MGFASGAWCKGKSLSCFWLFNRLVDHSIDHILQSCRRFGSDDLMTLPPMWYLFGADHLPYRVLLLARMIDRQASRQLQAQFGLSLAEWRVLAFICASGPAAGSAIARAGGIDRAEISRAVARLGQKGFVVREADPQNQRKQTISPTDSGEALFRGVRDDRRSLFHALLQGVPDDERQIVERTLEHMALRIQQLAPELED